MDHAKPLYRTGQSLRVEDLRLPPIFGLAVFYCAYLLACWFSRGWSIIPGIAISFWPPAGIFAVTLLLYPKHTWPWWVLAGCAAEMTANVIWFHNPTLSAMQYFAANAIEALVAASLVGRFGSLPFSLNAPRDVLVFVVLGPIVAPLAACFFLGVIDVLQGKPPFPPTRFLFWLGDGAGMLITGPIALVMVRTWQQRERLRPEWIIEGLALVVFLLIVATLSLNYSVSSLYLNLPVLLWIAVRFQFTGAAGALGMLTLLCAYFTATKSGAFVGDPVLLHDKIVELQIFLGVSAMSTLLVAALSMQHWNALLSLQAANASLEDRVAERTAILKDREASLQKSESHLRAVVSQNLIAIAETDLQGKFTEVNERCCELTGYSKAELVGGMRLLELLHPADRPEELRHFERFAELGDAFIIEKRFVRKDEQIVWILATVSILKNIVGKPISAAVIMADVTDRKSFERQIVLLMREVNHRSKNLLSLVQAIARQTVAGKHQDFLSRFQDRIHSLAASQDLVISSGWKGVDLESLVRSQLAHFSDSFQTRILIEGPAIIVNAAAAQTLGMALHELSTNAGKYGAMSNRSGEIKVIWQIDRDDIFEMSWIERGGPQVKVTRRRGFGSVAIQRLSKISLDADIVFDLAREGLTWKLRCRADRVLENAHEKLEDGNQIHPPA